MKRIGNARARPFCGVGFIEKQPIESVRAAEKGCNMSRSLRVKVPIQNLLWTIDAAMKYRDSILVGRVVPNAPRRLGDKPPYHRSRNI